MRFQNSSGSADHVAAPGPKSGPPGLDVPNQQEGGFFLSSQQGQPHRNQQQQQLRR
jgi:hypothetical protein